ncbi:hypothetical protein SRABI106_03794 [Rahnella aquatilis]|nr:hypothetical protein SRABI106_03794 [Rahnella aquatilis]
MLGNALIGRHQARARIYHEQHDIRFFDSQQRLPCHPGFNAIFGTVNTAGIHDDEFITLNFGTTILAVTRKPREIRHQRITRLG